MDGEYPEFRGDGAALCQHWFDFMADTRHWELEPYFDIDGTRAVALEEIEYVNYIEQPGCPLKYRSRNMGTMSNGSIPPLANICSRKNIHGEHFTGRRPTRAIPGCC